MVERKVGKAAGRKQEMEKRNKQTKRKKASCSLSELLNTSNDPAVQAAAEADQARRNRGRSIPKNYKLRFVNGSSGIPPKPL